MSTEPKNRPAWVAPYLAKLGVSDPGSPSLDALRALHRAHVERVPFENIDIQLGRPQGIDPAESIARIAAGRGGYCFNLNGAFAELLEALGYRVTRHRGQVHGASSTPDPDEYGNHMALTVMIDDDTWTADVGLGSAHHEPIPLRVGAYVQAPYTYRLRTLPDVVDGWRFVQDPALESFHSVDFTLEPAVWTDFIKYHVELSTSPESGFVKDCRIFRRDGSGVDFVVGTVLHHDDGGGRRTRRELTTRGEWFDAAADVFGLNLSGLSEADRAALWRRIGS